MNLTDVRLKELSPTLTESERALQCCRAASELTFKGQHGAAREALGDLWRGVGVRPDVEGFDGATAAEVLLQVGALSGWLGASRLVQGAQEAAKDLLSESAARFERLGQTERAALALSELALCYWREGAYEEARLLYERAFEESADPEQRAKVLLRRLTVEFSAKRYDDALAILKQYAPIFDDGVSHVLRGSYHNHLALVLRHLGSARGEVEYFDRAIIEYTAAIFHYELAQHERYLATNENNLAFLLFQLGRHRDAHEHLDRAQAVLTRLKDTGMLAQIDETRARVLVAEGRYRDAERVLAGVVRTLERGDEAALLADAMILQGVVCARLGAYQSSAEVLGRAADMAESAGALTSAGQALLTLLEEHGATRRLRPDEAYEAYARADALLSDSQDAEHVERLRACARVVMGRMAPPLLGGEDFSFPEVVREFEAGLIERALEESGGSVVAASRHLGLKHQTLASILKTRHNQLSGKRKPPQKRRKSIIKKAEGQAARKVEG